MRLPSPAGLPRLLELCCRVIETDEDGTAWIGSEAGNVKRVALKFSKLEGGGARQWLECSTTLKWRKAPLRTNSSGPQQEVAIASTSGGSTAVAASGELAAEAGDPGGPSGREGAPGRPVTVLRSAAHSNPSQPICCCFQPWRQRSCWLHPAHQGCSLAASMLAGVPCMQSQEMLGMSAL